MRVCPEPGCPTLVERGYCPEHQVIADRERHRRYAPKRAQRKADAKQTQAQPREGEGGKGQREGSRAG